MGFKVRNVQTLCASLVTRALAGWRHGSPIARRTRIKAAVESLQGVATDNEENVGAYFPGAVQRGGGSL